MNLFTFVVSVLRALPALFELFKKLEAEWKAKQNEIELDKKLAEANKGKTKKLSEAIGSMLNDG